jgi:hypothetical protein
MYMPNFDPKIGTQKNPDAALRELLTTLLRQSAKSRAQIAEGISVHVGQRISKRMLDDWTAESKKPARFPSCFVQAFCEVTENDQLQRHLLSERLQRLLSVGETVESLINSNDRTKLRRRAKR